MPQLVGICGGMQEAAVKESHKTESQMPVLSLWNVAIPMSCLTVSSTIKCDNMHLGAWEVGFSQIAFLKGLLIISLIGT